MHVTFEAVKEQLQLRGDNVPDDVIRAYLAQINKEPDAAHTSQQPTPAPHTFHDSTYYRSRTSDAGEGPQQVPTEPSQPRPWQHQAAGALPENAALAAPAPSYVEEPPQIFDSATWDESRLRPMPQVRDPPPLPLLLPGSTLLEPSLQCGIRCHHQSPSRYI